MPRSLREPAQPLFLQGARYSSTVLGGFLRVPRCCRIAMQVKRFTSVAHAQLLGLGRQLIEGCAALLVDGLFVGHQVG